MPNYTFQCRACGERFEQHETLQEHDRHGEKCPKCGSVDVTQRPGPVFVKTSKKS